MYIIICYNYITGGIIQHHCSDKPLDHAVQVIGYDFIIGMYYICKVNISCTLEVNVSTEFIKPNTEGVRFAKSAETILHEVYNYYYVAYA